MGARKELLDYFRSGLDSGMNMHEIEENLQKSGWPHNLINEAKFEIRNDNAVSTHVKPFRNNVPLKKSHGLNFFKTSIYLNYVFSFLVLVVGIFSIFIPNKIIPPVSLKQIPFGLSIFLFFLFIAISLFFVAMAISINKRRKFSRIVEIILFLPLLVLSLISIVYSIAYLVVPSAFVIVLFILSFVLVWAFVFDKRTKSLFN